MQNLGVTEAPLEQFSEKGGKMISGGVKTSKNVILQAKKRKNLELGGGGQAPLPPLRTGLCLVLKPFI